MFYKHKRIKNLVVGGALIGAFLFGSFAFAYDQMNTHPALTNEVVNFYNLNFPQKLNNQDKSWLIKGSVDEDQGMRPMNHFYDPVHNIGMAGFPTSKQWAMSSGAQSNFAIANHSIAESAGLIKSTDDFSYQRAIGDYIHGDRQRAMIAFGHVLHLLEDANVPDHTRNDAHPPIGHLGSPYEHEMAKWNPGNFHIADNLNKEGLKPTKLNSLGDYFDKIAKYSNGNFFSKDTIFSNEYPRPILDFWEYKQTKDGHAYKLGYKKDFNGKYILVKEVTEQGLGNQPKQIFTLEDKDILDGYWDRLSKDVVLNGTGALKLFIDEAEKAKKEYANRPPEKPSWFSRILGLIGISTGNKVVDNQSVGDSMVTPTPKVTKPSVSPTPLVTKTPDTNVTILSPTLSPPLTPVSSVTPTPSLIPKLSTVKKSGRVVINEIAWAGTEASATDEWLELYNADNFDIDITGWELVSDDKSPDIKFPPGNVIPAGGYFLIERTDDSVISDIIADLAISFGSGGLNNEGEVLKLIDSSGMVIDIAGKSGEKWFAGNSTGKLSMERISADQLVNNASNWKSFSGTPVNKDAKGNLINGTPKTKNSLAVQVVVSSGGGGGGGGGGSSSTPTPSPTPTLSATPSPSSTPTPTLSPSPTPSPSITPTPTPSSTPSPSPTPTPSSPPLPPPISTVVINEIAWMGTATSSNDEWMELRNNTSNLVDLTGWKLKAGSWTSSITLSGSIEPYGFYILERGPKHVFSDLTADITYNGGLALNNSGSSLSLDLKNSSGALEDYINGSPDWFGKGNNTTKSTMERKDPKKSGNDPTNWATNDGIHRNGHDAGGNPINGTPRAKNSVYISLKPSAVTNLAAAGLNGNFGKFILTWSAPNDLDTLSVNLAYDLRYATKSFATLDDWNVALKLASASLPVVAGKGASESASFSIAPNYNQKWFFALKTKVIHTTMSDVVSQISNVATVSFPTAIDPNSWAMLGKDQYHTSFMANIAGPGPTATISWEFKVDSDNAASQLGNVFRSNQISGSCGNAGNYIRLYDHNRNSQGAFPCAGGAGIWSGYFNDSYNDTTFTEFEQVGTLPCGTYDQCSVSALSIKNVVLRVNGWTPTPTGSFNNAVVSADGDIYFGASDGPSGKLIKLNKNGVKQWEYATNVSIGMPAVLSDGTVYFGRIGAGGFLAVTALNPDGSKRWDYYDASTVKAVSVSSKGEPHFTYQSGSQDKLAVLNPNGSVKTLISGVGLSNFSPIVLENGVIIVASYVSGNQFFTAYSADGVQLWQQFYTGANGNGPSNLSHDRVTGKTYSATGSQLFDISLDGSVLNAHPISPQGVATTMVAISGDALYVGFDSSSINPASGSRIFSLNKSDLTKNWSFSADSRINQQIAVDKDKNVYFSTEKGKLYGLTSRGKLMWVIDVATSTDISPVLAKDALIWGYGNRMISVK